MTKVLRTGQFKADEAGESPRWEEDALGFLIAPIGKEDFLENYYERKPLITVRGEPDRYADLLTLDIVDHFLNSADLREGLVDLTNHRNRIERDDYVDEDGRVSRAIVAEEYLNGATIILPQLHDSIFYLGEFCRALEEVLTCHMQTNIYLTPQVSQEGEANQGFPPHYDNHDVFVMQISGSKAWRIYGTPVETPFRGERFEVGRYEPGEVTQEFTLNPGDCLYLPRGIMHDAQNAGEEPSLHITVGMITKTWADLMLEAISELALSSPDFRRSLPAGYAQRDFDREPALRAVERGRRRGQADPDRARRRSRVQGGRRRRSRCRAERRPLHRRRSRSREARGADPQPVGRRLSGAAARIRGPRRHGRGASLHEFRLFPKARGG